MFLVLVREIECSVSVLFYFVFFLPPAFFFQEMQKNIAFPTSEFVAKQTLEEAWCKHQPFLSAEFLLKNDATKQRKEQWLEFSYENILLNDA